MKDRKLTKKQRKFADNYIKTGNGRQSSIDAGYSKNSANVIAVQNLEKPHIKKYIDKRMQKINNKTLNNQVEIHQALDKIIRDSLDIDFNNQVKTTIRYQETDSNGKVKEITKEYKPMKMIDVIRALELKAKLDGLLSKSKENEVKTININATIPNVIK